MRPEQHHPGDDERLLVFLADLFPVLDVGEELLVGLEILFFLDRRQPRLRRRRGVGGRGRRRRRRRPCLLLSGDFGQRQRFGLDDAQAAFLAQLAAEQSDRFQIRVDFFVAAGDEAGDQYALERRDIQLRLDRRFDRDLEVARAPGECADERQEQATDRLS